MPQTTLGSWLQHKPASTSTPKEAHSAGARQVAISRNAPGISKVAASPSPIRLDSSRPRQSNSTIQRPETPEPPDMPALPPNVTIEPCQDRYLQSFRRMNALLLPIPYRDDFYKETMEDPVIASVTRLALWHEKTKSGASEAKMVAAIRCRVLASAVDNPYEKIPVLYISTITTLAPFRGHSLGSHLLAEVTRTAIEKYGVRAVMGHVWEDNKDAIQWYMKRDFKIVNHEPEYYRRLAPKMAAFVIRRDIGPGDLLEAFGAGCWTVDTAYEDGK